MQPFNIDYQLKYWETQGLRKTYNHPINFEQLNQLLCRDSKILDYGCGYGRVSNELYIHGYTNIIGVDFSSNIVDKGRSLHPHLNLHVVSSLPLPFADNEFGAVFLFTVLTCIPSNQGQITLIQELKRILCNGGILYISDLCLQTDARNIQRYKQYQHKYDIYGIFELPEGVVLRHHDDTWIKTLTADFKPVSLQNFDVVTMNDNLAKAFQLFAIHL